MILYCILFFGCFLEITRILLVHIILPQRRDHSQFLCFMFDYSQRVIILLIKPLSLYVTFHSILDFEQKLLFVNVMFVVNKSPTCISLLWMCIYMYLFMDSKLVCYMIVLLCMICLVCQVFQIINMQFTNIGKNKWLLLRFINTTIIMNTYFDFKYPNSFESFLSFILIFSLFQIRLFSHKKGQFRDIVQ